MQDSRNQNASQQLAANKDLDVPLVEASELKIDFKGASQSRTVPLTPIDVDSDAEIKKKTDAPAVQTQVDAGGQRQRQAPQRDQAVVDAVSASGVVLKDQENESSALRGSHQPTHQSSQQSLLPPRIKNVRLIDNPASQDQIQIESMNRTVQVFKQENPGKVALGEQSFDQISIAHQSDSNMSHQAALTKNQADRRDGTSLLNQGVKNQIEKSITGHFAKRFKNKFVHKSRGSQLAQKNSKSPAPKEKRSLISGATEISDKNDAKREHFLQLNLNGITRGSSQKELQKPVTTRVQQITMLKNQSQQKQISQRNTIRSSQDKRSPTLRKRHSILKSRKSSILRASVKDDIIKDLSDEVQSEDDPAFKTVDGPVNINLTNINDNRKPEIIINNADVNIIDVTSLDDSSVAINNEKHSDTIRLPVKVKPRSNLVSQDKKRRIGVMSTSQQQFKSFAKDLNGAKNSARLSQYKNASHKASAANEADSQSDDDEYQQLDKLSSQQSDQQDGSTADNNRQIRKRPAQDGSQSTATAFKRYSMSRIDREFTLIGKTERQAQATRQIEQLLKENESFYKGKEVPFHNNSSFNQCIQNPVAPDSFITVQLVSGSTMNASAKCIKMIPEIEDSQLFNLQSESSLILYANMDPTFIQGKQSQQDDLKNDSTAMSQCALISFWSKASTGQLQCSRPLKIPNIVKRQVNEEQDLSQVLFTGESGTVIFFITHSGGDNESTSYILNVINLENQVASASQPLCSVDQYRIQKGTQLAQQLRYQLLEHKRSPRTQFSLPEPTLASIQGQQCLVLTSVAFDDELDDNLQTKEDASMTSLCFYQLVKLGTANINNPETSQSIVVGSPTYKIDGGELFLGLEVISESLEYNVLFLANADGRNASGRAPDVQRLLSPSVVKKISVDEIIQHQTRKQDGQGLVPDMHVSSCWNLAASVKSMSYFRTQSHLYPFVQGVLDQQSKCVTFRFYGNEVIASSAVSFQLTQTKPDEDSGLQRQAVPSTHSTLTGHFVNEDEEEVQVQLSIMGQDASNTTINEDASTGTIVTKKGATGPQFRVRFVTLRTDWVHAKFFSSQEKEGRERKTKVAASKLPFQILSLDLDTVTGEISRGEARLQGQSATLLLVPVKAETGKDAPLFTDERYFKLRFVTKQMAETSASIEGSFVNKPFNTCLVGEFTDGSSGRASATKFVIQKRNLGTIMFIDSDRSAAEHGAPAELQSFDVEVTAGSLADRAKQITLNADTKPNYLFENVLKIGLDRQNAFGGVWVLHGSLGALLSGSNNQRGASTQGKYSPQIQLSSICSDSSSMKSATLSKKRFQLASESAVKRLLCSDAIANEDGLIQELTISKSQEVTLCMLTCEQNDHQFQIRFVGDQLVAADSKNPSTEPRQGQIDDDARSQIQGSISQSHIVDYPILAYNSCMADNSEIILANVARKDCPIKTLSLDQWQFVCFVSSVCLGKVFGLNPTLCQVLFLARHQKSAKLRLLMLNVDPWSLDYDEDLIEVFAFSSCDFNLPERPNVLIKSAHCLINSQETEQIDTTVLLQYENGEMWSISLRQADKTSQVFDPNEKLVVPRHAVRRLNDSEHVYCIVESSTDMEVIKISLGSSDASGDSQGKLTLVEVFESHSSKILLVEPDPQDPLNLFLLDDEQKILLLQDNGEGKAVVLQSIDVSNHDLEHEMELFDSKAWTSLPICGKAVTFERLSFSLQTKFFWKSPEQAGEQILQERNLPGTLMTIQTIKVDSSGSSLIRCKPMACSNLVDLLGQARTSEKTLVYFATDDTFIVHAEDNRILVFDQEGYFVSNDKLPNCLQSLQQSIQESQSSHDFGKFFLLRDAKEQLTLLQSDESGFRSVMKNFNLESLKRKIVDFAPGELLKRLNVKPQLQDDVLESIKLALQKQIVIYDDRTMLSKTGELFVLASVVIDEIEESLTIFSETTEQGPDESLKSNVDDYSEYRQSSKIFGVFKHKQINLVLIVCRTQAQQLGLSTKSKEGKQKLLNKKSETSEHLMVNTSKKATQRINTGLAQQHFTFGLVGSKLVWLNFERKLVEFIDLDGFNTQFEVDGQVNWHTLSSPGFTVREVIADFTIEDYLLHGVQIDEIHEASVMRKKKTAEESGSVLCLMQLTVGNHATVFDLQEKNRFQITMIQDMSQFSSPNIFVTTGFVYNTPDRALQSNSSQSIGLERPFSFKSTSRGLHRAFSEMDLQQVIYLRNLTLSKPLYTKTDLVEIELETIISAFGCETFFTIFAEQAPIYDLVFQQLSSLRQADSQSQSKNLDPILALRRLYFMMDKPTPVRVLDSEQNVTILTDLSIVKQALLFSDSKARVSLFNLAELAGYFNLADYITCIDDLQLLVERLPLQQYSKVLSSLDSNRHTLAITEAVLAKHGPSSQFATFIQDSAVISEYTPELGLHREQSDDEIKSNVSIRILPLQWISAEKGSQADLFKFFRLYLDKLHGSLLLDAIFNSFWSHQQKLILKYAFFPYLAYFTIVNFYYYECMLMQSQRPAGIFSSLCSEEDGASCDYSAAIEPYFRVIFFVLSLHQLAIEVFQLTKEGFVAYIQQRSNQVDICAIVSNQVVLLLMTLDVEIEKVRLFASVAIVIIWIQMFYWFRLFDSLAQYVDLIFQTVQDIRNFMYVLISLMLMFGSGLYLLNINRITLPLYDKQPLIKYEDAYGSMLGQSLLNQYLIILGDFGRMKLERDSTDHEDASWIWAENMLCLFYFFGSTFFCQIVILNMLIAIMSATFDRHNEDLQANAMRQKLVLQAEFIKLVDFYKKIFYRCGGSGKRNGENSTGAGSMGFLFVIQPASGQDDDSQFAAGPSSSTSSDSRSSGSSLLVKRALDDKFRELDNFLNKKMLKNIQDLSAEVRQRLNEIEQANIDRNDALKKEMIGRFSKLRDEISESALKVETQLRDEVVKSQKSTVQQVYDKIDERRKYF